MSREVQLVLRLAIIVVVAIVVQEGCAHALDREAVVERMLSPHGDAIAAAVVTGVFVLLRLAVLFVLPGVVLARLVLAGATRLVEHRRR